MRSLAMFIVFFLIVKIGLAQELQQFDNKGINSEFSKFSKKKKISQKSQLFFGFEKDEFEVSIKNTMNIYSTENETFTVDTSNPIPENDDEKEILDYAMKFVGLPVKYDCYEPKLKLKLDTLIALHSLINFIPALHSCLPLSGVVYEGDYNINSVDTVMYSYKNGVFVNEWMLISQNELFAEIALKGRFVPDKGSIPTDSKIIEDNNELVDTYLKSKIFSGKCIVNKKNKLIENLELKIDESTLNDYHKVGFPFEEIKKSYFISIKSSIK